MTYKANRPTSGLVEINQFRHCLVLLLFNSLLSPSVHCLLCSSKLHVNISCYLTSWSICTYVDAYCWLHSQTVTVLPRCVLHGDPSKCKEMTLSLLDSCSYQRPPPPRVKMVSQNRFPENMIEMCLTVLRGEGRFSLQTESRELMIVKWRQTADTQTEGGRQRERRECDNLVSHSLLSAQWSNLAVPSHLS